MKKFYTMMMMAMMALTFTACEDEYIADTLEGTWSGNMEVSSYYDGRDYYCTRTEISFNLDPFRFTKGSGYWVDHYPAGSPWHYVANHINWRVDNGNITVHFVEDGTTVVISDYHLSDTHFTGYIEDGDNDVYFSLVHISSPNWDDYDRWGYDGWYDDYYWSRSTRSADADSTATMPAEKPIRQFGKKAE